MGDAYQLSAFKEQLRLNRPLLPDAEALLPYLRLIDRNRFYTNFGPLHDDLLNRLTRHFSLSPGQLGLANSGTAALIALILGKAGRATRERPYCICPSYSFAAAAVAAEVCGYRPLLVDVDENSMALNPATLLDLPELPQCALVIPVAPYGQAPDIAEWAKFSDRTSLAVIFDAAACFDTLDIEAVCRTPVCAAVSMHATKTFSTAEGGLMLASESGIVDRAVAALNFGFLAGRDSVMPGINGKMSEYHAAIGLAELDTWPKKRQAFLLAARRYRDKADSLRLGERIRTDFRNANPYALFMAASEEETTRVAVSLERVGIETRMWYGRGLHHQPQFKPAPDRRFLVTDSLAERVLGLPFAPDMTDENISRVVHGIAAAIREK